jgi:tRNA nucleotidyltransferase (CCA-adding enzyme)
MAATTTRTTAGSADRIARAWTRLRRRPEIRALARLTHRDANPAWLVGGAVRDAALGLPIPEIDAAVGRDAEGIAAALQRAGFGTAVFLSRDRPGPRVFRVAGRRTLDLAEIEGGSIERDLRRRDFTANAIAVCLDDGRILDPFGGLSDLSRGRLRCVDPGNLLEDPLRALRAARFLATHGLSPDAATLAAARRAAPGLCQVARERIVVELSRLLEARRAAPAFAWAVRAGVLPTALGLGLDLSEAEAARAARSLRPLDAPAFRRLTPESRRRLRLARLAGALGLPPEDTRRWLSGSRLARREAGEVARLQALASSAARFGVQGRRDAVAWLLEAGEAAGDALRLASLSGRAETERRVGTLKRLARTRLRSVSVKGDDVMRWLSLPPGPRVGELLGQLRLEAALGTVRSRREARDWLAVQVRRRP